MNHFKFENKLYVEYKGTEIPPVVNEEMQELMKLNDCDTLMICQPGRIYSWEENQWVEVTEFERLKKLSTP